VSAAQVADRGHFERPPEALVGVEIRRDGVALVALDDARGAGNTMTTALGAQLVDALSRLEDDARISAIVLASAKPDGFMTGVDDVFLTSIKFAGNAERFAQEFALALARLEAMRKPIVAAVHGPALGAGFGLALACHAIVASDDASTVLGLPEAALGIVSPGNGALRVAVRAGLRVAIDVSSGGSLLGAAAAAALDLVDEVCPRAILLDAAARHARALIGRVPRVRDERAGFETVALEKNALGRAFLFRRARARAVTVTADERRGHAAASLALEILQRFADKGFDDAARLEAKVFGDLVVSATAHRLIELAAATAAVTREAEAAPRPGARPARNAIVIGGGAMGAGLATLTATAGVGVRLKERDDETLGRALRAVRARMDAVGPRESRQRDDVFGRVTGTSDLSGLRNADIVFEAVSEDLALKQDVLRQAEEKLGPRCVYATCTASIPVGKIARASSSPERIVGLHALDPADEAALLEVVRADRTAPWAIAAMTALARRQGKPVIVVRDGSGFYTRRVLAPYFAEALQLLADGVDGAAIERALVDWGFVVGPLQKLDETGIDVAARVAHGLQATLGPRMTPPGALGALLADDRRGRQTGRGLFRDAGRDGKRALDSGIYGLLGVAPRTRHPQDEIAQRCALALVNEAVRCLGDGVLRDARDGDLGAVFGLGFPRFRGGPFRYVDAIGAADVLRRVQGYADRFGDRWRPAPLLVQMARKGERFFA
jgi:3-hydroxyacyl-CoA dehydrogenase/enoyl-CoA hydratase/3-hydroxybutyryl-CoA epimerase